MILTCTSLLCVAVALSAALLGWEFTLTGGAVILGAAILCAAILCALIIWGGPIWLAGIGTEEEVAHAVNSRRRFDRANDFRCNFRFGLLTRCTV